MNRIKGSRIRKRIAVALSVALVATAVPMLQVSAATSYTEYDIYIERPASEQGNSYYHGAKYEPVTGSYLAMYAEGDDKMHNWNAAQSDGWYFGGVPSWTHKDHAAYMFYVNYSEPDAISHYASHLREAKARNKGLQISLQPNGGLDQVQNDAHLASLVRQAADSGTAIFLRFGGEMNDNSGSNKWYGDPTKYVEKFRIVANAFHAGAPNVVMVWAPNDWPIGNEHAYYPGDEYVDWVGVSSYPIYLANGSPKQKTTWMDRFREIYDTYGGKKPIMIVEGAPGPNVEYDTSKDVTWIAAYEIRRFYAGAARRYPNLKMITFWSNNESSGRLLQCKLSGNNAMLEAYRSAIADNYYISNFNTSSDVCYRKASDVKLKAGVEKLSCYFNDVSHFAAYAAYKVNNTYVGEGKFPDYTASVDFSGYAGKSVTIAADFYTAEGNYIATKKVTTSVSGSASSDLSPANVGIVVNGTLLNASAAEFGEVYNIGGRVYVPLRKVAEYYGCNVAWDGASRSATISYGGRYARVTIGSKTIYTAAGSVTTDAAPMIIRDRTYLPIRATMEQVGARVEWNNATKQVIITNPDKL